jgi:CDP-glycerol glycerophosphotransferase (TagB/SpsB family)
MSKIIAKVIKRALSIFGLIVPKKNNRVLFKSVPDYAGNCKALSDFIRKNHDNYEVVWIYSTYKKDSDKDVIWVKNGTLKSLFYILTSKYIVTTHNEMIGIKSANQEYISLWHGMPLKKICYLSQKDEEFMVDYSAKRIATSEIMRSIIASAFHEKASNVIITGQPRNDFLFEKVSFPFCEESTYRKIIVYAPTFRQNEYVADSIDGDRIQSNNFFRLCDFDYQKLCEFLENNNFLLLVKLHPFEENALNGQSFPDYIKIIKSKEFNASGYDINHLLCVADCLLTDYSSVYFDYLILNRPIGFVIPDYESYKLSRGGFTLEPTEFWMPGEKLSMQSSLLAFLDKSLNLESDDYRDNRSYVSDALNTYKDNKNSERVFKEFIGKEI